VNKFSFSPRKICISPPISPSLGIRRPRGGRTSRLHPCYEVASPLVSALLQLIRHLVTNAAGKASLHKPIAMAHIEVTRANNGDLELMDWI